MVNAAQAQRSDDPDRSATAQQDADTASQSNAGRDTVRPTPRAAANDAVMSSPAATPDGTGPAPDDVDRLPIKTFVFLDKLGNPVVRPGTTWEQYEEVVRQLSDVQVDNAPAVTHGWNHVDAEVVSGEIGGDGTDPTSPAIVRARVQYQLTVEPDRDGWTTVPLRLRGAFLTDVPTVTRLPDNRPQATFDANPQQNSAQQPDPSPPPSRTEIDPQTGRYQLKVRLDRTSRLRIDLPIEVAVSRRNRHQFELDLPAAITTILVRGILPDEPAAASVNGRIESANESSKDPGVIAKDSATKIQSRRAVAPVVSTPIVEGRGGEIVRRRGSAWLIQGSGGTVRIGWDETANRPQTSLVEANTEMNIDLGDDGSSPIATVQMNLRELRQPVSVIQFDLPPASVLLDRPEVRRGQQSVSHRTEVDAEQRRVKLFVDAARSAPAAGNSAMNNSLAGPLQVKFEISLDATTASAAAPLSIRPPVLQNVLRHRGTVSVSTDPTHRLRWQRSPSIRAVSRSVIEGGTTVDRFAFDRQDFVLPIFLANRSESVRVTVDGQLTISSIDASIRSLATLNSRVDVGRFVLDARGWSIGSVRDADTKLLLETYADPVIEGRLIVAAGGGTATGGATTSIQWEAKRRLPAAIESVELPLPELNVEAVATDSGQPAEIEIDRTLTIDRTGRRDLIVDLDASTAVAADPAGPRGSTAVPSVDPLGRNARTTTNASRRRLQIQSTPEQPAVLVGRLLRSAVPMTIEAASWTRLANREIQSDVEIQVTPQLDLQGWIELDLPRANAESVTCTAMVNEFAAIVEPLPNDRFRIVSDRLGSETARILLRIEQTFTPQPGSANGESTSTRQTSFADLAGDDANPKSIDNPQAMQPSKTAFEDERRRSVRTIILPAIASTAVIKAGPIVATVLAEDGLPRRFSSPATPLDAASDPGAMSRFRTINQEASASIGSLDNVPNKLFAGDLNPTTDTDPAKPEPNDAPERGSSPGVIVDPSIDSSLVPQQWPAYRLTVEPSELPMVVRLATLATPPGGMAIGRCQLASQFGSRTRRDRLALSIRGSGLLRIPIRNDQIDDSTLMVAANFAGKPIQVAQGDRELRIEIPPVVANVGESSVDDAGGRALQIEAWAVGDPAMSFCRVSSMLVPPRRVDSLLWDVSMPSHWHLIQTASSVRSLMRWRMNGLTLQRQHPGGFDGPAISGGDVGNRYLMAATDPSDLHLRLASRFSLWMVFGLVVLAIAAAMLHLKQSHGPHAILGAAVAIGGLMIVAPDAAVIFGQIVLFVLILIALVLAINSLLRENLASARRKRRQDRPPHRPTSNESGSQTSRPSNQQASATGSAVAARTIPSDRSKQTSGSEVALSQRSASMTAALQSDSQASGVAVAGPAARPAEVFAGTAAATVPPEDQSFQDGPSDRLSAPRESSHSWRNIDGNGKHVTPSRRPGDPDNESAAAPVAVADSTSRRNPTEGSA